MANKESFKTFVSNHPILVSYVNSGEMSWQKFYEMYDLYGEENSVWGKYLNKKDNNNTKDNIANDFMSFIKGINVDKLQSGMESLQRVLGVVADLGSSKDAAKDEYVPRPLYKHFDD